MTKKILLIEDDNFISKFVSFHMKKLGFEVKIVDDGRAGLNSILTENFDLIILDIVLPEIDGIKILEITNAKLNSSRPPVIVISGHGDPETIKTVLSKNVSDFIVKPFEIDVFMNKIKKVMNISEIIPEKKIEKSDNDQIICEDMVPDEAGFELIPVIRVDKNYSENQSEFLLNLFKERKTRKTKNLIIYFNDMNTKMKDTVSIINNCLEILGTEKNLKFVIANTMNIKILKNSNLDDSIRIYENLNDAFNEII